MSTKEFRETHLLKLNCLHEVALALMQLNTFHIFLKRVSLFLLIFCPAL